MKNPRKLRIAILTGTRADYGLLYPIVLGLMADPCFEPEMLVTGMHLSPEFGMTVRQIEEDGLPIGARVEMLLSSDSPVGISKSIGLAVSGCAEYFQRHRLDLLMVLGDRFEALAAVIAAMNARVPVAHIHGGESTEGLVDEAIRHAITKMSHLHFTSTQTYRRRIIQMGEQPDRVFCVGAPGIDTIRATALLGRAEFEAAVAFRLGKPTFLVTYHPVTLDDDFNGTEFNSLLNALDQFSSAHIIFTKPNADANGRVLSRMIDEYVANAPERTISFTSMGQQKYLSALANVDLVVGNSSSGLIEAPHFRVPTVNIGERQRGRIAPASVIQALPESTAIAKAIRQGLSPEFKSRISSMGNPYGDGTAAPQILQALQRFAFDEQFLKKRFYDYSDDACG